ncbi:MAG TPA: hypothetical protein VLL51_02355 [Gemmatimonadales bacterium]|nr:hypothetical protein [Gemmatimonadales bacterium]
MTSSSLRLCRCLALALPVLAMVACREVPTGVGDPMAPSFKPGQSGPSYTVLSIPVASGWSAYAAADINAQHQTVGIMNPADNPSQSAQRAAYWVAGSAAAPVPLPVPDGMTRSQASAISENGIIAGRIWPIAVLWRPSGSGWTIETRAECGTVSGVRNDGVAVGTMLEPPYCQGAPQPVVWDAGGIPDTLPLPEGGPYTAGTALAVNAQGDVAGTLEIWTLGMSTVYGALWVRDGDGYTPLVMQTGWSRGLSDRTNSGQIYVTASGVHDAHRHRFTRSASGQWTSDSVYVEGIANRMNAAGTFVGALERGRFGSSPKPYVFPAAGVATPLPLPKNATGAAGGISSDGWITGHINGVGVVWKPGS